MEFPGRKRKGIGSQKMPEEEGKQEVQGRRAVTPCDRMYFNFSESI